MSTGSASANGSRRIAAIDVGTNSVRLIVAEAAAGGSYRILDDEKETTRLGQGLDATGAIAPAALEQTVLALARMKRIALGFGVQNLRAIGTCAVREASNRDTLLERARCEAQVNIEPITAEEEALLAQRSVAHAFDLRCLAAAVVDLGGGSTEVILSTGGVVETIFSLPLGAVRVTEHFAGPERCAGANYERMRRAVRRCLRRTIGRPPFIPQVMIGTGGTFTTLANLALQRGGRTRPAAAGIRGYELKRSEVRHLIEALRALPARARARVPGLSAERSEIIIAGATIVERMMKHLGVNRLLVHDGGIRDGLLLTMARALFPPSHCTPAEPPDRLDVVRQFASSCGYEEQHAEHVARLSGEIFDELTPHFPSMRQQGNAPAQRQLLEAAALLRDIGYLINYSKHHRHSYHLIVHADLPGFTPREITLIALVARYHRRALPRKKHAEFAALPRSDRRLVSRLAAILRLADGLDRNRMQNIRHVRVRPERRIARFLLEAETDPAVDIWGATQKAELFRKVFRLEPRFEWIRPARKSDDASLMAATAGR